MRGDAPGRVRFGASTLPAQDLPAVLERVAFVESCGFDTVSFPDTQGIYPDPFVAMAAVAATGSAARLTTSASNPVTRHPSVMATAIGGVQELARGGAFLTLATGDSSLLNIGRPHARLADLRAYAVAIRDIQRLGEATYGADRIRYQRRPTPAPIHVSAHGPRSLQLAGEVADGVWIGVGIAPDQIDEALRQVQIGAARAGRSLADLEIGCYVRCFLGTDVEAGTRALTPSLAAVGNYALTRAADKKGVPAALLPALRTLAERYDSISHATGTQESANSRLVRELGLVDYLAGRFALIGAAETITAGLRRLVSQGIRSFAIFIRGPDADEQMRRFGREIIPAVTSGGTTEAEGMSRAGRR